MPVIMIMTLAVTFYFVPEPILSDFISAWNCAPVEGRINLIKVFLKFVFVVSFAVCFAKEFTDSVVMNSHAGKNGGK